jgi:hypothetical protein
VLSDGEDSVDLVSTQTCSSHESTTENQFHSDKYSIVQLYIQILVIDYLYEGTLFGRSVKLLKYSSVKTNVCYVFPLHSKNPSTKPRSDVLLISIPSLLTV